MSGQTFSSLRHHQGQLTTPHELPTTTNFISGKKILYYIFDIHGEVNFFLHYLYIK